MQLLQLQYGIIKNYISDRLSIKFNFHVDRIWLKIAKTLFPHCYTILREYFLRIIKVTLYDSKRIFMYAYNDKYVVKLKW